VRRDLRAEIAVRIRELRPAVRGEHGGEDRREHDEPRHDEAGDEHAPLPADGLPQLADDRESTDEGGERAHQYLTLGSIAAATRSTMKFVTATMTASRATMPCTAT